MKASVAGQSPKLNRGTGLLVIEVRHSNPNGDPDAESEPRTMDTDGRGLISPVSFKRKLRDLVSEKEGPAWMTASKALGLAQNGDGRKFDILETRGRDRAEISKMEADLFINTYWDGRVFGCTFLDDTKKDEALDIESDEKNPTRAGKGRRSPKSGRADRDHSKKDHFITTGVVQFGPGVSIAPIEVERLTMTNKSGVETPKDRGMAPLGWRVVRHAVYAMPFFVNPMMARKSGCQVSDIELMKFLIPHAYRNTASAIRPFVEIQHAWYAEHKTPLGSCPDWMIIDSLKPRKVKGDPNESSTSIDDYECPKGVSDELLKRLANFEDLCDKQWE